MMLKAEGSYCEIYLESGEKLLASKNLKYFEDKLDDVSHLFRCHKSYVINLKVVNEFNKSSGVVSLINGITASISMEKTDLFFEKMEMLF
jgi:two-component system LytT family response regulator